MSQPARQTGRNYANRNANISLAYQMPATPAYAPAPRRAPRPPRQAVRVKQKQASAKPRYVVVEDASPRVSLMSILTIIFIFACGFSIALSYAFISQKQNQISALHADIKDTMDNNERLRAEISQKFNLDDIRNIATKKLGMSEPKPYQIVYINVPKQSYVVHNELNADEVPEASGLGLQRLWEMLTSIPKLIQGQS